MAINLRAFAFLFGISLQLLLFSRGEWDRHAPKVVSAHTLLCAVVLAANVFNTEQTFAQCVVETYKSDFALIGGLSLSMGIYRLLFHPLKSFSGPLSARVSSFWVFRENWPDLKLYMKLRTIHDHYGDFVRIRPRELSICHPDAIKDVHGIRTGIRKGEFYEQIHPAHSLQFTRDPDQHRHQRRYWDKAFQVKALRDYTPRVMKHYQILMGIFMASSTTGGPIDVSKLFMNLFFDVVSDLTFGESFNTLTTGKRNPIIEEFLAQQQNVGFVLLNMWIFHLIRCIPLVVSCIVYWMQWCASSEARRKNSREKSSSRKRRWYANAMKSKETEMSPDLYTHLSQSDTFEADGVHETQLAIIAGADTNAITVSNACYLLCQHPEYQQKLYEELSDLPAHEGVIDDQHLMSRPWLSSIIKETLRLCPPVPGGLQRQTPPEGATIAGRYVPGNMVVSTPTYALHRDPRAFVRPNDFVPERWTSQPNLILRKDAFVPFSYGAYSCAGKPLAMMQLRMVIAMIIKTFQLSFAPGRKSECERYIQDQADCFTLHINPLPIVLRERANPEHVM